MAGRQAGCCLVCYAAACRDASKTRSFCAYLPLGVGRRTGTLCLPLTLGRDIDGLAAAGAEKAAAVAPCLLARVDAACSGDLRCPQRHLWACGHVTP